MAMPETPMNENHGSIFGQYQVGTSWKIFDMKPEPEATAMQKTPDHHFRLRMLPPDTRHHPAPGCTVDYVDHAYQAALARRAGTFSF